MWCSGGVQRCSASTALIRAETLVGSVDLSCLLIHRHDSAVIVEIRIALGDVAVLEKSAEVSLSKTEPLSAAELLFSRFALLQKLYCSLYSLFMSMPCC